MSWNIIRIDGIPNPNQKDNSGKPFTFVLCSRSTWNHITQKHLSKEADSWIALLGVDLHRKLEIGTPALVRDPALIEATGAIAEQIENNLVAPLFVTHLYSNVRGRRTWLLPLECGARLVIGRNKKRQSEKDMRLVTCFFSRGLNQKISNMVKQDGTLRVDAPRNVFATAVIQEIVSRYSNRYQLPDQQVTIPVNDYWGTKNYTARNIEFVLAVNWGFESDETGANWSLPAEYPAEQWSRSGSLEVTADDE